MAFRLLTHRAASTSCTVNPHLAANLRISFTYLSYLSAVGQVEGLRIDPRFPAEDAEEMDGVRQPFLLLQYRDDITILNHVIHSNTLRAEPYTRS